MFVSDSNLAGQLAALGNIPGDHQGDGTIRLPGGGQHTVASASLRLFTEGVIGMLPRWAGASSPTPPRCCASPCTNDRFRPGIDPARPRSPTIDGTGR